MTEVAAPAQRNKSFQDKEKPMEVRLSNIVAAKAVGDAIRTSLGPRGMDKMIQTGSGEVVITNDGATILKHMAVLHPAAKMLVDLSAAQDVEAGDGTTSVVVLCSSLLAAAEKMLNKGIHPTTIAESFQRAAHKAVEFLTEMATPVDLSDRESLLRAASTSLNSKIVSQYSSLLAPIAVDAVLRVVDPAIADNVNLNDVRVVKKVGGTIDDTELVDGLILHQNVVKSAGGPTRIEKAKIGLVQFQLSPPKPDMENQIVVNDYRQMDKILKEERQYLLNMCKKIKKSGCNVLLIQKSILRDAVNELSLHFLAKLKILVVKDVERDEIEFISKSLGCKPVADVESFTDDKLGYADLVEEVDSAGSRIVKITGMKNAGKTVSVVCRGANSLVLEESHRSLHDALCVVRCLVKKRALIAGGGAPEIEVSQKLMEYAKTLRGMEQYCFQAFAEALEVIPTTLAENAGLNPISIVTELRNKHALGEKTAGINVKKGTITNILEENVIQPLLVSTSALELAAETVKMILKIDDLDINDSFPSAPVRYAFDDDESEDEYVEPTASPNIRVELAPDTVLSGQLTLVLGLVGPGSVYLHASKQQAKLVGRVLSKHENQESEVEQAPVFMQSSTLAYIPFSKTIVQEEASLYARSVLTAFAPYIERVIVLDYFTRPEYISEKWGDDLKAPYLRVLQTSSTGVIPDLVRLEPPNMVKGISAALLTYCEIHTIPCLTLLSLQESLLGKLLVTTETLDAYAQGLRSLGCPLAYDESQLEQACKNGRVDEHHHRLYL